MHNIKRTCSAVHFIAIASLAALKDGLLVSSHHAVGGDLHLLRPKGKASEMAPARGVFCNKTDWHGLGFMIPK